MQMYERGIDCFQKAGLEQFAQPYEAQLAGLEAQRG